MDSKAGGLYKQVEGETYLIDGVPTPSVCDLIQLQTPVV
jgi:hypothetical protein